MDFVLDLSEYWIAMQYKERRLVPKLNHAFSKPERRSRWQESKQISGCFLVWNECRDIRFCAHVNQLCKRDWNFSTEVGEEEASSIYISIQGSLLLSLINSSVSKPKKRARKRTFFFCNSLCNQFLEERGTQIKEKRWYREFQSFLRVMIDTDPKDFICMSQKKCPSTLLCMLASS